MYIVIHDLDCFVLLCIDIWLNTLSVFMAHELDFSWVKIVTISIKLGDLLQKRANGGLDHKVHDCEWAKRLKTHLILGRPKHMFTV